MTKTEIDTVIVMKNALDELRKAAETMSRCMAANHISPLPSFYDAHNRACYALGCAEALAQQQQPVAWKHACNALCVDGLELWIDACPHCGKPRSAGAAPATQPDAREVVEQLLYCINCWRDAYAITATSKEASAIQAGQKLLESLK